MQVFSPRRAACAATALARLPVEEQPTVSKPKLRALASATETTRSLKLSVGRQTASFLIEIAGADALAARCGARISGVNPRGSRGRNRRAAAASLVAPHARRPRAMASRVKVAPR